MSRTIRIYFIAAVLLSPCVLCGLAGTLQAMPPVEKLTLPNGLVVLISEEHSLPFVTMQVLVDAGSSRDPSGKEGLSCLTVRSLLLGTAKRNAGKINEELDFLGASLSPRPGRDFVTLGLRVLSKDFADGFALFMEALTEPTFPAREIKQEIGKTLGSIKAEEDEPGTYAEKEFEKTLFLKSPYGHPVEGTKESLPGLTEAMVREFYRTHYHAENMILVVVGDLTVNDVKKKILPHFEKMAKGSSLQPPLRIEHAEGPKTAAINRAITQTNIIMGNKGISRNDPDFYALSVLNYILGRGGFSSRLTEEVRNKRGLAYAIDSELDVGRYPGSIQIALQTKNSSAREAMNITLKEVERIRREAVSEKELEGAKKYFIGSFPMRLDTQAKLAGFLLQVQYYGLGLDYARKYPSIIESISTGDLLRVAKAHFHPDRFIIIVVGNLKEAGLDSSVNN